MMPKYRDNHKITDSHFYRGDNGDEIFAEVSNTIGGYFWRLRVNGYAGHWSRYYEGIYVYRGWCYATNYWKGTLVTETPFRVTTARMAPAAAHKDAP